MVDRILDVLAPVRAFVEPPFVWFLNATEFPAQPWWYLVYDLMIFALGLTFVRWALKTVMKTFKSDRLSDRADIDALVTKNPQHVQTMEAARDLEGSVARFKKAKDWNGLAETYAALNEPKLAAKFFKKAGNKHRCADQLAKSGQTVKAARILFKLGDFLTAARFFRESGKHADAAKSYAKAGLSAEAAQSHGDAGNYKQAFVLYLEYFQQAKDDMDRRAAAAEKCFALLQDETVRGKIGPEVRQQLFPFLATTFEKSRRHDLAGLLFKEAGDLKKAGEVFLLAGKLEEAARCMQESGNTKEASRIAGMFYENANRWKEAAQQYASATEYVKAGECYAKAKEPVRSAECYAKGQAWYRAGLGYAHAGRFEDAVAMLQKLPDTDKDFDSSRALLGRCFYEIHDYAHCAATLDNHLTGKRVDRGTIDYFYMLALAQEQLGQLRQSRDLLYKIGAVDKAFRDVGNRVSSIDSRISMLDSQGPALTPSSAGARQSGADGKVMEMVERSLGERYDLEQELGRGGMGVVYLARDKQLDRKVALKFLGSLVDNSEEYRQRFIREARSAAKISHPNIVNIYDISASEGKAYIAMEFVEGVNLFKYVQSKGKLSPREARNLIAQTCDALQAIHQAGIVHRDIKPDNILIAKGGLVKLMDFGLAKSENNRMTKSNVVMGTPCYMSPEQVLGKDADPRSDVYAIGLVLHEVLTGRIVFGDGDVLVRQLNEIPPKPSEVTEGVAPEMDAIVMKSVAKDPAARYQSAKEMLDALKACPV